MVHPFVLGELVLGGLPEALWSLVEVLPRARVVPEERVLDLVEDEGLGGRGIGWVDAHLLAAARFSGTRLWTSNRSLGAVAATLRVVWSPG